MTPASAMLKIDRFDVAILEARQREGRMPRRRLTLRGSGVAGYVIGIYVPIVIAQQLAWIA